MSLQHDYAARKTKFLERLQEVLLITDIEKPLTRENYKEKFHKLLCWEEKTHIEILEERLFLLLIDVYSCTDNQKYVFLIVTGALGNTVLNLDLNHTGLIMPGGITTKCLDVFQV